MQEDYAMAFLWHGAREYKPIEPIKGKGVMSPLAHTAKSKEKGYGVKREI